MSPNDQSTQSTPVELAIRNSLITQAQLILAPHLHAALDQVLMVEAIAGDTCEGNHPLMLAIGILEDLVQGLLPSSVDIELFEHLGLQLQGVRS